MTKDELITAVAQKAAVSKKDTNEVVKALSVVITEALENGDSAAIAGLGTFCVVNKPESIKRNPRTGENITVAAHKMPKCKISAALKTALR